MGAGWGPVLTQTHVLDNSVHNISAKRKKYECPDFCRDHIAVNAVRPLQMTDWPCRAFRPSTTYPHCICKLLAREHVPRPEWAHLLLNATVSVTKLSAELKMRWKHIIYFLFLCVHENLSENVHFVCTTLSRTVNFVETHHWWENEHIFYMPILEY